MPRQAGTLTPFPLIPPPKTQRDRLLFFSIHLASPPGPSPTAASFYPPPPSGASDDLAHNVYNAPLAPLFLAAEGEAGNGPPPGWLQGTRADFRRAVTERLVPTLRSFNPKVCVRGGRVGRGGREKKMEREREGKGLGRGESRQTERTRRATPVGVSASPPAVSPEPSGLSTDSFHSLPSQQLILLSTGLDLLRGDLLLAVTTSATDANKPDASQEQQGLTLDDIR